MIERCESKETLQMDGTWDGHRAESVVLTTSCEAHDVLYTLSWVFVALGFVGLGVTRFVLDFLGIPEAEAMEYLMGVLAVSVFSGMFILGLVVLFPLSLILERRAKGTIPWSPELPNGLAVAIVVAAVIVGIVIYMCAAFP